MLNFSQAFLLDYFDCLIVRMFNRFGRYTII